MASFKRSMTNIYITEEITIGILSRLPVKSLIRFCCVCKSWPSLIHSSNFISQHLSRSTLDTKGGNLLVTRQPQDGHSDIHMDVFLDGAFDAPVYSEKVLPTLGLTPSMDINVNHGLLFIHPKVYHSYVIYNPATRQFREIPKLEGPGTTGPNFWRFVLFGVIEETNDYKLISTLRHIPVDENEDDSLDQLRRMSVKRVEVYTKSTGLWREIDGTALTTDETQPYVLLDYCSQIQVKGALYWISSRISDGSDSSAHLITGFNVRSEKFYKLAMPDFKGNDINEFGSCTITEIEGSLALIACNENNDFYHVWTMDERGDQAWTKKFKIKPFNKSCPMVWGWKNCLVEWNKGFMPLTVQRLDEASDSLVQEMKNVWDDFYFSLKFHKYVESLIHV